MSHLKITTFNIRGDFPGDAADNWHHRKSFVVDVIRANAPDLIGTQEVLSYQGDYLREQLPEYGFVGVGREDGAGRGEFAAIFYRLDRFALLESGTFWLSETPENVGSKGWDADWMRIVTWAKLRDRNIGRTILHANTHWDHMGTRARLESAKLMRDRVVTLAGETPTVITGDFNSTEDDPPYAALMERGTFIDTYRAAHPTIDSEEASFNGFTGVRAGKRIDWILCSKHFTTRNASIDRTARDGRYPSDHFPVTAEVGLQTT